MIRLLPLSLLILAAGCAAQAPHPAPESAASDAVTQCDAAAAQDFVGKQASADVVTAIEKRTHSVSARVLGPDSAMTMDYRSDRVNIAVDADKRIQSIRCG